MKTLREWELAKAQARYFDKGAQSNGLACDHCGSPLVDTQPGVTLTSDPPKKTVACFKCGFTGYRTA